MKAVLLQRYPVGRPGAEDFALATLPDPVPGDGEMLVRVTHLSLDPVPRLRMRVDSPMGPPMRLGQPVEGRGAGQVVASRHPGFAPGDWVAGDTGWAELATLSDARAQRLDMALGPAEQHLHALGATGLAAFFAVEALAPDEGDTMLVAPAAGAVGGLACAMARLLAPGARLAGTAIGPGQAAFLEALGVEALDPEGAWPEREFTAFLDGVGGALHDRALRFLAPRARILLLGYVAGYNDGAAPRYGNAHALLMRRLSCTGFLLADHMARADEARRTIAGWLADGRLRPAIAMHDGLGAAPAAFVALFADAPPGKQMIRVGD